MPKILWKSFLLFCLFQKLYFKTPGTSNPSSHTRTVSTDHDYPKPFIKLVAGTTMIFTLAKRNKDFMSGKRNISRPFRKVITLLLSLITLKQLVMGSSWDFGVRQTWLQIVKLGRPCLFGSCSQHWMSMSAVKSFYFIRKAFPLSHFTDSSCLKRLKFLLQMFSV